MGPEAAIVLIWIPSAILGFAMVLFAAAKARWLLTLASLLALSIAMIPLFVMTGVDKITGIITVSAIAQLAILLAFLLRGKWKYFLVFSVIFVGSLTHSFLFAHGELNAIDKISLLLSFLLLLSGPLLSVIAALMLVRFFKQEETFCAQCS